jgi:hypothetical protein
MNATLSAIACLTGILAIAFALGGFLCLADPGESKNSDRLRVRLTDAILTGGIFSTLHDCSQNWAKRVDARRLVYIGILFGIICGTAIAVGSLSS